GGGAGRRPQPGLQQLNELVDEARDASASAIRLIVSGRIRPLDPGIELTAYRLVQEALTNARRHAPRAAVDVELRYREDALVLRIRDNGPGPVPYGRPRRADTEGHGLVGMRERAATVGGVLRTASAPGGGFLVEASLPVDAGPRTAEAGRDVHGTKERRSPEHGPTEHRPTEQPPRTPLTPAPLTPAPQDPAPRTPDQQAADQRTAERRVS
ncbi:sensor histidine kinase, partial [Streptomyces sp. NPDC004726]